MMNTANIRNFEQLKSRLDIENLVKQLLPDGKGFPEWRAINPTRDDKKAGSFQVNLQTGLWIDFATDDKGDILSLYAYIKGCSIAQSYDDLDASTSRDSVIYEKKPKQLKRPSSELIYPAPADAFNVVSKTNHGIWCYRDKDKNILMYVTRHNLQDGNKYYTPHTYRQQPTGSAYWDSIATGLTAWPLFNLDVLHLMPDANVMIVEGEKTAVAASTLMDDWVVTTWHGGSNAYNRVDLEPLRGRKVWLFPDNDKVGNDAMLGMQARLLDIALSCELIVIPSPEQYAKGWDLADGVQQGIKKEDVMQLINNVVSIEKQNKGYPDLNLKNNPLNTTDNVAYLLKINNVTVRYNLMTNQPEFFILGKTYSKVNEDECYFTEISNLCVKNNVPKVDLASHLVSISDKNRYHPAMEFIESKPWDGISRINELLETVESEKQKMSNKLIYRWLISCVAALYLPKGISCEGALVFQGEQKIGKTYWFMKLLPENKWNLLDSAISVNVDNKDDVIKATSIWLGELGEIETTFKKSDVNALKNFITKNQDTYRVPFGRKPRNVPRRTIFFGSVNTQNFLVDETGNRRYWTIPVTKINYNHTINMQQLWAEVKELYDEGESYRLTNEEQDILNIENQDHQQIDPLEEQVHTKLAWHNDTRKYRTCTEVLEAFGYKEPKKSDVNRLAGILIKMDVKKGTGAKRRHYYLPISCSFNI